MNIDYMLEYIKNGGRFYKYFILQFRCKFSPISLMAKQNTSNILIQVQILNRIFLKNFFLLLK